MFLAFIFVLALGSVGGYEAGKATQKVQSYEQHKVCLEVDYLNRKAGCYEVSRVPSSVKKTN